LLQTSFQLSTILSKLGFSLLLLAAASICASASTFQTPSSTVRAQDENRLIVDEIARLSEMLKSGDAETRRDAVRRLAALRSLLAVAPISSMVNDPAEAVRAAAIAALGHLGDPASVPVIAPRLAQDKSIFVRKTSAYALGGLRTPAATGPLVNALKDKSEEVRGAAAVALGEYRDANAILPLVSALSDKNDFVRARAARALGNNGPTATAAIPGLIRLLQDDRDHYARQEAVVAMGKIGDRSALPALTRASLDPNPHLASEALAAIKSIEKR